MNWFLIASILMFLSVGLGAFGAHALKFKIPPEQLQIFEIGIRYQIIHALSLFVIAHEVRKTSSRLPLFVGWFFLIGIILFSVSLYAYSITRIPWLVFFTPVGGFSFLVGWFLLILHYFTEE